MVSTEPVAFYDPLRSMINQQMKGQTMFRRNISMKVVVVVALAIAVAMTASSLVQAQVKKGKVRPMKTAQWMKGVMKPQCDALKKGLDAGPATDEAWEALAANAGLLNEASFLLMDDGRCPDGVWAEAATKTLRLAACRT
jgi:hypothetical protein